VYCPRHDVYKPTWFLLSCSSSTFFKYLVKFIY
jgi:hypothetical protein